MAQKQNPCVVCGPSGVGKGTLLKVLMESYPDRFSLTVSHTTRKPRNGEEPGVDYNYVSRPEFEEMIEKNQFLEYLQYSGNYYGTSVTAIDDVRKTGKICILDIAVSAAQRLRDLGMNNANYLFITLEGELQEKKAKLKQRLIGRNSENAKQISKRIGESEKEFAFVNENDTFFDYVISNDNLQQSTPAFIKQFELWYPDITISTNNAAFIKLNVFDNIKQQSKYEAQPWPVYIGKAVCGLFSVSVLYVLAKRY